MNFSTRLILHCFLSTGTMYKRKKREEKEKDERKNYTSYLDCARQPGATMF